MEAEQDMPEVEVPQEEKTDKIRVQFDKKDEKSINITYQTIQDLARVEAQRAELQKLDSTFFIDLISYLSDKKNILKNAEGDDLFSSTEKENTRIQLENVQKLLDKLYDRRERKIVNMALDKSRVGGALIDTNLMLNEEKLMFNKLNEVFNTYREGILTKIKDGKAPVFKETALDDPKEKKASGDTQLVRFLSAVPKFVGKNLETIGPFDEEDVANLPKDIAKVLIEKGRAEPMDEDV